MKNILLVVLGILINIGVTTQIQFEQIISLYPSLQNIADFEEAKQGAITFCDIDGDSDPYILALGSDVSFYASHGYVDITTNGVVTSQNKFIKYNDGTKIDSDYLPLNPANAPPPTSNSNRIRLGLVDAGVKLNFTKIADFGGDIIYIEGRKLNILGKVAPSNGSLGTTELLLQAPSNIKPNIKVLSTGMTPAQKNMKVLDGINDYWSKTNEGFIDDIIANSGDIRFIHDPRVFGNGWIKVSDLPTNTPKQIAFKNKCVSENLIKFRSFLGREYDYLLSKGYVLQESGLMIKS